LVDKFKNDQNFRTWKFSTEEWLTVRILRVNLTPEKIDPIRTHPSQTPVFGCIERKSTLIVVSCIRIREQKKWKSTRGYNFALCALHSHLWQQPYFAYGLEYGHNQTRQISDESLQGFRIPRGRKWPSFVELVHHPNNYVRTNVLHCDISQCLTAVRTLLSRRRMPTRNLSYQL